MVRSKIFVNHCQRRKYEPQLTAYPHSPCTPPSNFISPLKKPASPVQTKVSVPTSHPASPRDPQPHSPSHLISISPHPVPPLGIREDHMYASLRFLRPKLAAKTPVSSTSYPQWKRSPVTLAIPPRIAHKPLRGAMFTFGSKGGRGSRRAASFERHSTRRHP